MIRRNSRRQREAHQLCSLDPEKQGGHGRQGHEEKEHTGMLLRSRRMIVRLLCTLLSSFFVVACFIVSSASILREKYEDMAQFQSMFHLKVVATSEISAINIGRDDHEVWFGFESRSNSLHLELRVPPTLQALCNVTCIYRYYIHGGSSDQNSNSFGGYLNQGLEKVPRMGGTLPATQTGSLLSATVTAHESGNYTALVYLESLGEDVKGGRLPLSLLTIPGGINAVADKSSEYDVRFVATVVSDPFAQLYANVSRLANNEEAQMQPCRYEPQSKPSHLYWRGVSRGKGRNVSAHDEKCNLVAPTRNEVLNAADKVKGGVRVVFVGTSRLDDLNERSLIWLDWDNYEWERDKGNREYWPIANSSLTVQLARTEPPASEKLAQYLRDQNMTCSSINSTDAGLTVFVISYGIWDARINWHDVTTLSVKEFADAMRPNVEATLSVIEGLCMNYRIVWAAQPGTTAFRGETCSEKAPNRTQPADIVLQDFFGGLSPATPHLRKLNTDVFEELARRRGELYVPLDELYLAQCHLSDHVHLANRIVRKEGVNMIFSAVLSQIDHYVSGS